MSPYETALPGAERTRRTARKLRSRRSGATAPAVPRRVSAEQRHRMIAEAAYFRAAARGGTGDPLADWLAAEADIDGRFAGARA